MSDMDLTDIDPEALAALEAMEAFDLSEDIGEAQVQAMATVLGAIAHADGQITDDEVERAADALEIFIGAYTENLPDPAEMIRKVGAGADLNAALADLKEVNIMVLLDFLPHAVGVAIADGEVTNGELDRLNHVFEALAPEGQEQNMRELVGARVEAQRLEIAILNAALAAELGEDMP